LAVSVQYMKVTRRKGSHHAIALIPQHRSAKHSAAKITDISSRWFHHCDAECLQHC